MRTFAIAAFVFVTSLGVPLIISAAGTAGASCTGSGQGTCDSGLICTVTGEGFNTCVGGTTSGPSIVYPTTRGPGITPSPGIKLVNPLGEGSTLMSLLLGILDIITGTIGPVIVILMLVFVGFKFVAAQGVPGKIEEARGMLLWTVVGALILLGAKVIAMGIQATVTALGG